MKHLLIAAALIGLSACAAQPESIMPISMAGAFDSVNCPQARAMLLSEQTTLSVFESRQRNAAAGDFIGVALTGIPVASMTGNDVSGQIAASKGKVAALQQRVMACGG